MRLNAWEQVQQLCEHYGEGCSPIGLRGPQVTCVGDLVSVSIDLPDEMTILLDGVVREVSPLGDDATRSRVLVDLHGLNADVRARLRALIKRSIGQEPHRLARGSQPPTNDPHNTSLRNQIQNVVFAASRLPTNNDG